MKAPSVKNLLKSVQPSKRVIELIKRSDYIRNFVRDILRALERREFNRIGLVLKDLDKKTINEILTSIGERGLTSKEFKEFYGYLYSLYTSFLEEWKRYEDYLQALKKHELENLPIKKVKQIKDLKAFLNTIKENKPKGYKELTYRVALFLNENLKVVDARIFATKDTYLKYVERAKSRKLYILITPNPVRIPRAFWSEYRKVKGQRERIELIQKYGLLKDENAFVIELLLDIDSPYEQVKETVKDLLRDLGIKEAPFQVKLMKTGSGNARLIIPLKLPVVKPTEKNKNGHTHLENLKEALAIIAVYLQRKGLNVDLTSIDRLNHQIWCYSAHPKPDKYEIKKVVPTLKKITPYDLYRKVKKLQREQQLYTLKRGDKEVNLTIYFGWRPEFKLRKKTKVIRVPKFIAELTKRKALNTLKEDVKLYYWKKTVKSLADKHNSYRFTYVILPAVGWAKYLGLDRYEVESYLKEVLSDRDWRKTEKDIDTAFRVANELEFNLPKGLKTLNFEELIKATLRVLLRGEISRQELIKKVFGNQKWLTDLVMNALVKVGLVEVEFFKAGRGRPRKVFRLTEKGKQVADHLPKKVVNEAWRIAVGQDFSSKDFSLNNNSPSGSFKVGGGEDASPGESQQDLINLTKSLDFRAIRVGCIAQLKFAQWKAPEWEPKGEPPQREGKTTGKGKADRRKVEKLLNRLINQKPKRGGISSLGEILGLDPPE